MKNYIVIFLALFLLSGCASSEINSKLSRNAAQLDGYVRRMNSGETTRQEDQDLIRAMRIWTWSMNKLANDEVPPMDIKTFLDSHGN